VFNLPEVYLCVLAEGSVDEAQRLPLLSEPSQRLGHGDPQPQPEIHGAEGPHLLACPCEPDGARVIQEKSKQVTSFT